MKIIEIPNLTTLIIQHPAHGRQKWEEVIARTEHICCLCQREIHSGEYAYRPRTNLTNRQDRFHTYCQSVLPVV